MGWSSGTSIFDTVCRDIDALYTNGVIDKITAKKIIKNLLVELEDHDWDTVNESYYFDQQLVKEVIKKLHPNYYED